MRSHGNVMVNLYRRTLLKLFVLVLVTTRFELHRMVLSNIDKTTLSNTLYRKFVFFSMSADPCVYRH